MRIPSITYKSEFSFLKKHVILGGLPPSAKHMWLSKTYKGRAFIVDLMGCPVFEDRVATGLERYQRSRDGSLEFLLASSIFEDNSNVARAGSNITRFSSLLRGSTPQLVSRNSSHQLLDIGSSPEAPPPSPTSGRRRLVSVSPLNLGQSHSNVIPMSIGTLLDNVPLEEIMLESPAIYTFDIILRSVQLLQIIYDQLQSNDSVVFTGVELVRVSRVKLGRRRGPKPTLRIRVPSSGAVTAVKSVLLSMNLEEASIFHTYYAGRTVTLSEWKLKDHHDLYAPNGYGSQVISTRVIGIQR